MSERYIAEIQKLTIILSMVYNSTSCLSERTSSNAKKLETSHFTLHLLDFRGLSRKENKKAKQIPSVN